MPYCSKYPMYSQRTLRSLVPFCLLAAAEAYTVFNPDCSKPTTTYNFVSNPDSRSTLDILWSSLFTLFACTWTIQHPNIPEQRAGRSPGWKGDIRWGLKRLWATIKLACITVLAPEIIITVATVDLVNARRGCHDSRAEFEDDNVPWTLSHSHFADMGGFVIRVSAKSEGEHTSISEPPYHNPYHLSGLDVLNLRRQGHIPRLPLITEEDIHDRSKADPVLKCIAVIQILFSTLQTIVRAFRGLAVSLLELAVVAFAVCAVLIYALHWKKPKSVQSTITLLKYQGKIPPDILGILDKKNRRGGLVREFLSPYKLPFRHGKMHRIYGEPFNNTGVRWNTVETSGATGWPTMISGWGATTLFGAVHVVGWNFSFPTRGEQIAWRAASLYTACFGITFILSAVLGIFASRAVGLVYDTGERWWVCMISWLYLLARLFIVVEIIRTLFFLPPDAYVSTWVLNLPHFT